MSSHPRPQFVYKIVPSAPPSIGPEQFPLSPLDEQDGFVHLSTGQQVPATCDRFFTDATELWFFKFELAKFTDPIKWEGGFPHLYGNFGGKDVLSVQKFEKPLNASWSEVMDGSKWLE